MNTYIRLFLLVLLMGNYAFSQIIETVKLPRKLKETSALLVYNNNFWTINDSGGRPEVYSFDSTGKITHKVYVEGVQNIDWEALAVDGEYMYVGDFGNNFGNRKNLRIVVLALKDIYNEKIIPSGFIYFNYEDQANFSPDYNNTSFDCEAFLVKDSVVYLFTKDWQNRSGALYTLPNQIGHNVAKKVANLNADALITDVSWFGESVVLIGYRNYNPVLLKYRFENNIPKRNGRILMKEWYDYQTEGICFVDGRLFITSEKSGVKQSLFEIKIPQGF